MKCPRCWSNKAYLRRIPGFKGRLLDCLLIRPMKCHHCYHRFAVSWFVTIGKKVTPSARASSCGRPTRLSHAARHVAAADALAPSARMQGDDDRAASSAVC